MLVSAKRNAGQSKKAGHYAVGHFNINNLEWTKAILLTAQENNSPLLFWAFPRVQASTCVATTPSSAW